VVRQVLVVTEGRWSV